MALILTSIQYHNYKKAQKAVSQGISVSPLKLAFLASAAMEGVQLLTPDSPLPPLKASDSIDNKAADLYCQQLLQQLISHRNPQLFIDAIRQATHPYSSVQYADKTSFLEKKMMTILREKITTLSSKYQAYLDYLENGLAENEWYAAMKPNTTLRIVTKKNAEGKKEVGMIGTDEYYDNLIKTEQCEIERKISDFNQQKTQIENDKTISSHDRIVKIEAIIKELSLDKTLSNKKATRLYPYAKTLPLNERELINNAYSFFQKIEDGNRYAVFQEKYDATASIITALQKPAATLDELTDRLRTFVAMKKEHTAIAQCRDSQSSHLLRAIFGSLFSLGIYCLVSKIRRGTAEFWQPEGRKVLAETEKLAFGFQYQQ